jgi:beta-N-acetylhexosaminidase
MNIKQQSLLYISILIIAFSCANSSNKKGDNEQKVAPKKSGFKLEDFFTNNSNLDAKVDSIFNAIDSNEKAAQMIMPAVASNNFGMKLPTYLKLFKAKKVGGVLFLKGKTTDFTAYKNAIQASCKSDSILYPLISADAEAALMHYKFTDVAKMTAAENLKTTTDVINNTKDIIKILKTAGINVNFSPVADNNINKAIIRNRSFGKNSAEIVPKCLAVMSTHTESNVATCIKHFPGHGNVNGDTHKGLVPIIGELTELETFKQLIKKQALGVMVAHLEVRNNAKWGTNGKAATLSRNIVTNLLKDSLQFKGLIYTDALNMGAVSKVPNASYQAVCAGVDIALMPLNVEALHKQIVREISKPNGEYTAQFIASIKKVIRMKVCLGLL